MDCSALLTVSACATGGAGLWLASPAWLAVSVVLPALRTVTVLPATLATVGSELAKLTVRPESAAAARANGAAPNVVSASAPKEMD